MILDRIPSEACFDRNVCGGMVDEECISNLSVVPGILVEGICGNNIVCFISYFCYVGICGCNMCLSMG